MPNNPNAHAPTTSPSLRLSSCTQPQPRAPSNPRCNPTLRPVQTSVTPDCFFGSCAVPSATIRPPNRLPYPLNPYCFTCSSSARAWALLFLTAASSSCMRLISSDFSFSVLLARASRWAVASTCCRVASSCRYKLAFAC